MLYFLFQKKKVKLKELHFIKARTGVTSSKKASGL